MKTTSFLAFLVLSSIATGQTINNFEGVGGTPFSLEFFADGPGPSVQPTDGNPGGFLQLTGNINNQNNWVMFDGTNAGNFPASNFNFQFRLDNLGNGGADGFSFSYFDTALFGTTGGVGASRFTPEDPAVDGVLGFGFDTWGNAGPTDYVDPVTQAQFGANYSEISLFYRGNLISRVDDTRLISPGAFNLKDGAWHTATGNVNFQGGTVSLSVDGVTIFNNTTVPGLAPFESRIGFAGRTGNANERAAIDNLNVQFVPEPSVLGALALGSLVALRRRRR